MQPQRGKPPTRGALRIMRDNAEMYSIYHSMAFGLTVIRLIISALYTVGGIKPNLATQSATNIIMSHFSIPILLLVISYFLKSISLPQYSNTPERRLISPGYDLMMNGDLVKYLNEMTVIITLTHVLSVLCNLFWFILLILPLRGVYLFWKLCLCPKLEILFTDNESEDSERSKKKAKKTGKKKFKYLRTIKHWHHFR